MREIRFRGKRIDNGEWVYGYMIGNDVIVGDIVEFTDEYFNTDVPLNQRPYLCECGGYVVSPSGKTQGKWIDESTAYGNDCPGGKCEM